MDDLCYKPIVYWLMVAFVAMVSGIVVSIVWSLVVDRLREKIANLEGQISDLVAQMTFERQIKHDTLDAPVIKSDVEVSVPDDLLLLSRELHGYVSTFQIQRALRQGALLQAQEKPFSRRNLRQVNVTRSPYESLIKVLLREGYMQPGKGFNASPIWTSEKGVKMLEKIGAYRGVPMGWDGPGNEMS